jgi:hypothetical protein
MIISYLTCTNFKSTIVYLIKSFSIHILLHSKAIVFLNDNFIKGKFPRNENIHNMFLHNLNLKKKGY